MYCSLYLVELKHIEQVEKLPVLLLVHKLDVVLLEAVESQLRLVVHVDLERLYVCVIRGRRRDLRLLRL